MMEIGKGTRVDVPDEKVGSILLLNALGWDREDISDELHVRRSSVRLVTEKVNEEVEEMPGFENVIVAEYILDSGWRNVDIEEAFDESENITPLEETEDNDDWDQ